MVPYYDHAGITIYHGDCREILPSISADVLITDPPYGVNLGDHRGANETRSGYLVKSGYASYQDTDANLRAIVVPGITAALSIVKRGSSSAPAPRSAPSQKAHASVAFISLPGAVERHGASRILPWLFSTGRRLGSKKEPRPR